MPFSSNGFGFQWGGGGGSGSGGTLTRVFRVEADGTITAYDTLVEAIAAANSTDKVVGFGSETIDSGTGEDATILKDGVDIIWHGDITSTINEVLLYDDTGKTCNVFCTGKLQSTYGDKNNVVWLVDINHTSSNINITAGYIYSNTMGVLIGDSVQVTITAFSGIDISIGHGIFFADATSSSVVTINADTSALGSDATDHGWSAVDFRNNTNADYTATINGNVYCNLANGVNMRSLNSGSNIHRLTVNGNITVNDGYVGLTYQSDDSLFEINGDIIIDPSTTYNGVNAIRAQLGTNAKMYVKGSVIDKTSLPSPSFATIWTEGVQTGCNVEILGDIISDRHKEIFYIRTAADYITHGNLVQLWDDANAVIFYIAKSSGNDWTGRLDLQTGTTLLMKNTSASVFDKDALHAVADIYVWPAVVANINGGFANITEVINSISVDSNYLNTNIY